MRASRLLPLLSFFLPILSFAAGATQAAGYEVITPIGDVIQGRVTLEAYLLGAFQILIAVAGGLAVVMLVVCGIKYMTQESAGGKGDAKDCIWNAIFGLLIALGAWVLLYTVNPQTLKSDLLIADLPAGTPVTLPGQTGTTPNSRVDTSCALGEPKINGCAFQYRDQLGRSCWVGTSCDSCLQLQNAYKGSQAAILTECKQESAPGSAVAASEKEARITLCGKESCLDSSTIWVKPACPPGSGSNCVNLTGLPQASLGYIKGLQAACGCFVQVSGGTEPGHKSHGAGRYPFDLRYSEDALTKFLKANGQMIKNVFGGNNGYLFAAGGMEMIGVDEMYGTPYRHWHFCRPNAQKTKCE